MTNKEKMIEAMKLIKEGCENIYLCNSIDCPLYKCCDEWFRNAPCDWIIEEKE